MRRCATSVIVWLSIITVALVVSPVVARAQATPDVSGRVRDIGGGALAGAAVVATPESGGSVTRVQTDAEGRYALTLPHPGRYRLEVRHGGFSTASRSVDVTRAIVVDWSLDVASVSEQLTVLGDGDARVDARAATKSDTPLREVPLAVSMVPLSTIRDQFALTMTDALRNVAGNSPQPGFGGLNALPRVRGFQVNSNLRNGFRQEAFYAQLDMSNVERIEVLKGPASALYGRFEPGGVVNVVPKRPLAERRHAVELSVGSYDLYRVALDTTGPLSDGVLRYRVNFAFQDANSHRDFVDTRKVVVTPSVEWRPRPTTIVAFESQILHREGGFDRGFIVFGGSAALAQGLLQLPPSRNLGEPTDSARYLGTATSVTLDQRLSAAWSLRAGAFLGTSRLDNDFFTSGAPLMPTATTYNRRLLLADDRARDYTGQLELTGRLTTGSIRHQLLVGTDTSVERYRFRADRVPVNSPIDPFDPVYGRAAYGPPFVEVWDGINRYRATGVYAQDELSLGRVRVLAGGRFDTTTGRVTNIGDGAPDDIQGRTTNTFSPRAGVTYVLSPQVSVYASAARSFLTEIFGVQANGELTDPSRGRELETGVKTDLRDGRLSMTVAAYHLAKANVVVADPDNPGVSIQTGEQRSRGLEVEVMGHLMTGVAVTGAYAYNDAEITKDTDPTLVGRRFVNTTPHTVSAWLTKDTPVAGAMTLTVGGGVFRVGDRPVNNANLFLLPAYTRVDAVVALSRGPWRLALNARNLGDERFFDSGGSVYYPGAPRELFLSLDWKSR